MNKVQNWKEFCTWDNGGFWSLKTDDTKDVVVRLFLSADLLADAEETLYTQIVNACGFPGVKMVIITPDCHYGYGVPVGCVLVTEEQGAIAMGPVGYDIGCGMMSAKSSVLAEEATPARRLQFNTEVMKRVSMGAGGKSHKLGNVGHKEFNELVRGGAEYYVSRFGATFDRSHAERHRIPVDDKWDIPFGGRGRPERGIEQIGSLGGGNHFIELQRAKETGTLFVQVHTGSRGFGHDMATNYFDLAKEEKPHLIKELDLGYFTPDSRHYRDYLNAVAAGGNFAIINRLVIFEQVSEAFEVVFGQPLELVYEISHNLVQKEWHPDYGNVWVHRKGATRAFPAGYPMLCGTQWEHTGHPVLIPGSNKDWSYILRPEQGVVKSAYSVNHGAGRRLSRSQALKRLDQAAVNAEYAEAGILVNTDGQVPLDESREVYKSSEQVIKTVVDAGLARVEFSLWPLCSLKGKDERTEQRRKGRKGEGKQEGHY